MADAESLQRGLVGRQRRGVDVSDEVPQRVLDRGREAIEFGDVPLGDHLDAAVGQVSNVAGDLKPPGEPGSRRPEPHALNVARV